MKIRTSVKAGKYIGETEKLNHNVTQLRSLKVRTGLQAGGTKSQHNETLLCRH